MQIAIIASSLDPAAINIRERLIASGKFIETDRLFDGNKIFRFDAGDNLAEIYTISSESIHFELPESRIDADAFIFASMHKSSSGKKTLSMHYPGNYSGNEHGGKQKGLAMSFPKMMMHAFPILYAKSQGSGYDATLEATHHGPYSEKPCMFIEIGSGPKEWDDMNAGEIIASCLIESIISFKDHPIEPEIAFGGTHYCANLNNLIIERKLPLGHICPKYNMNSVDEDIVEEMILKTPGNKRTAVLDWKGLSAEDKEKLLIIFENKGISWKKSKSF